MKIVQPGEVIGHCTCDGCGAEVEVKVNRNNCVYYYCAAVVGERNGKKERCITRHTFGRTASERIIADYLEEEQIKREQDQVQKGAGNGAGNNTGDASHGSAAIPAREPEPAGNVFTKLFTGG